MSELAEPVSISLPAILQHLKAMEKGGLVRSEKNGRIRTVRLAPDALSAAESWIADRKAEWEAQLDRFEDHLSALKNGEIEWPRL